MYKYSDQKTITDFSESSIESEYDNGYVFTRLGKGVMHQIESLRVNLSDFELSSENKRILKKNENLKLEHKTLPLEDYNWEIGKLAKDFYTKFGDNIMSANKIKELFTDKEKSNMNFVFVYSVTLKRSDRVSSMEKTVGYCLCYKSKNIIHYSYPFYSLPVTRYSLPSPGMTMMLQAIKWAKNNSKQYIYLGSDNKYKHQFKGLELFKDNKWNKN